MNVNMDLSMNVNMDLSMNVNMDLSMNVNTDLSMNVINNNNNNTPNTNVYMNILLLKQYINALSINIEKHKIHNNINLIFDSGAVNGLLGIGSALYLKHLQDLNYINVHKVSGCSIGSIIALWYLCSCSDIIYPYLEYLFSYYKKNKNFFIFKKIVKRSIYKLLKNDDLSFFKNRLYINYYDTIEGKQEIVCNFKNREHLIECILKSSHVPYVSNDTYKYENRYIDGISPYIFNNNDDINRNSKIKIKNLFIKLIDLRSPLKSMYVKNEKNIYSRILKGVTFTNEFFINNNFTLCMYINNKITFQLYIRQYIVIFIIFLIDSILAVNNNLPKSIKECCVYKKVLQLNDCMCDKFINYIVNKIH